VRQVESIANDQVFPLPGKRIAIIGATGSGKTTLARQLSGVLPLFHIELDSILWLPNWQKEDWSVVQQLVQQQMEHAGWVTDGNYSKLRNIIWQQADTIIWLDYPFLLVFYRLFIRTMRRVIFRTRLWNNNRESFRNTFLSKDSLFLWLFQSYPRHKEGYPQLLHQPEYSHLKILRFNSPSQTRRWLQRLSESVKENGS
jgi:energy-coupling factor transporter ATP-binding protein EcfA2